MMNHLTTLYIHGKDAKSFLQGQVTCDMNLLESLKAQPSGCCNLQGRLVSLFFALLWKEGYLLIMPKDIVKNTVKHFKKYAVFSKVVFEQDPNLICMGFLKKPELSDDSLEIYTCLEHLLLVIANKDEQESETNVLSHALNDNAWHYQQMSHGFPDISPETQETFLPHRIGLQNIEGVLNFKKGCYLGQEIIARTHFKATLKHTVCLCDEPIGDVFDSATSPDNVLHYLCAIKNEDLGSTEVLGHILRKF